MVKLFRYYTYIIIDDSDLKLILKKIKTIKRVEEIRDVLKVLNIDKKIYRYLIINIKKSLINTDYYTQNKISVLLNNKKYINKDIFDNYSIYEYDDKYTYFYKKFDNSLNDEKFENISIHNVKINNKLFINITSIDKLKKKLLKNDYSFSFIIKKN